MSYLWQLEVDILASEMDAALALVEDSALSSSWYLTHEDTRVHIVGYYPSKEALTIPSIQIDLLRNFTSDSDLSIKSQRCEDTNWVDVYTRSRPAVAFPPFYIYGGHLRHEPKPLGLIPLWIEAATAFGSGEHQTTSGCLMALGQLHKNIKPQRILDMGCGTGILAVGAKKLWSHSKVFAGDIDPEAVRLTIINGQRNSTPFQSLVCAGFNDKWVKKEGPYDLIIANILAKPLCFMALSMVQSLTQDGVIVLSGLIQSQEQWVKQSYQRVGFKKLLSIVRQGWVTLVMRKI